MSQSATDQNDRRTGDDDVSTGEDGGASVETARHSALRGWLAVVGLALGVFSFVTTETLPIGLLPAIADGTSVSVGTAGFLVSGFAAMAAVTAAPLTALTGRLDRKWLLVALMVVYTASTTSWPPSPPATGCC